MPDSRSAKPISSARDGQKETRRDGETEVAVHRGRESLHYSEKKAEKLFDLMANFAGYGFNKSHSAAYALVTYQTAYLKAHYPTEFMAALMTNDMGNADKMVGYFTECRDFGIRILPPDVNESQTTFTVVEGGIRFGSRPLKMSAKARSNRSSPSETKAGDFGHSTISVSRIDLHKVNKRVLEGLIKTGAFDSTGARRSQLAAVLDQAIEDAAAAQRQRDRGQTSMFGATTIAAPTAPPSPILPCPIFPNGIWGNGYDKSVN